MPVSTSLKKHIQAYQGLHPLLPLLFISLCNGLLAQQPSFDWQPKPVTETILDSASGSPVADVNIEYWCLEETDTHELMGYFFLTDSLGQSSKEVWVRREITGIKTPSVQKNYGIGIRGDGMISVHLGGIIRDISIYDLTGRMVRKVVTKAPEGQVLIRSGIASLPTGMYLAVARGMDGREVTTRFVQTVNSNMNWQTSPGYYPLRGTTGWQAGDRKSTAVDEITTRFLRTITYDNVSRIDTVILTYDEGKDTTLVTKLNIPPQEYGREVVIHFIASIPGKHIPDGVPVYLDEMEALTDGDSVVYTYTAYSPSEKRLLSVTGLTGYDDIAGAEILIDKPQVKIDQPITAQTFQAQVPVHVEDADQGSTQGAQVKIAGITGTTDASGNTTLNVPLETNSFNEFIPYDETVSVTKGNSGQDFEPVSTTINLISGQNSKVDIQVRYLNGFWLFGNNSSPEGAAIRGWKDGQIIFSATIDKAAYETNHFESTQSSITLDSLVVTFDGYERDVMLNYILTHGGQRESINLKEKTPEWRMHGKLINSSAEYRLRNVQDALILERPNGEKYYVSTDANGEFDLMVTAEADEQLKVYVNTQALPDYQANFLSLVKDNEAYPINRVLTSSYDTRWNQTKFKVEDITNPDTARITAKKLDDDYIRATIVEDSIAHNENLIFGLKNGTLLYEPTIPLQPYVWTIDRGTGLPITASQEQMYEKQMTNAIGFLNLPETGMLAPVNNIQKGEELPPREGNWMIYQWKDHGDFNGPYQGSVVGYVVGAEAHTDEHSNFGAAFDEAIGWNIPDGLEGDNHYGYKWDLDNEIPTSTTVGKASMNIQYNWKPLSLKKVQ